MFSVVRIFVIEEVRATRERIGTTIRSLPDFRLIGLAGGLEEAQAKLLGLKPEVILLDCDMPGMDEYIPIEQLMKALPGLIVICTSQQWDETGARLALRAGAKGYLAKSFTPEELLDAVKSIQSGVNQGAEGKVITLFSAKGGCGKTTLAVNLAAGLEEETGLKIGVIDANLQFGDVAVFLNLLPTVTVSEAARDLKHVSSTTLGAYLTSYSQSLKVLASPSKPESAELVGGEHITSLVSMMRSVFHYIIVDTEPGFNETSLAACEAADTIYVVAALTPDLEFRNEQKLLETFRMLGYEQEKVRIVLSRVPSRDLDILKRLEQKLAYPITALLPNDFRQAAQGANGGRPIITSQPRSPLAKGIMDIVRDAGAGNILAPHCEKTKNSFFKMLSRR